VDPAPDTGEFMGGRVGALAVCGENAADNKKGQDAPQAS